MSTITGNGLTKVDNINEQVKHTLARDSSGNIYAAYTVWNGTGGYLELWFKKSTDEGVTWDNGTLISDVSIVGDVQIAIDSDDNLHFVWTFAEGT
jgi:hypothetical protein